MMDEQEPKKILIVDDDEGNCMLLARVIGDQGFKVFTALNGEQALKLVAQECPQVCFIDLYMSEGINGIEILRRIKSISRSTRCVVLTCADEEEKRMQARIVGADGYYLKPLDVDKIRQMVREYV